MIDEQHAAAVLYGGGAPSATAKGTPTPRTDAPAMSDGVAATALYGEPKPDPAAEAVAEAEETHKNLRDVEEAEAAERARLESTYGSAMRTARSELADRAGFDLEVARADAEAAGRLFDQHGVTSDDAQHLTEIAVSATVNGVRKPTVVVWSSLRCLSARKLKVVEPSSRNERAICVLSFCVRSRLGTATRPSTAIMASNWPRNRIHTT